MGGPVGTNHAGGRIARDTQHAAPVADLGEAGIRACVEVDDAGPATAATDAADQRGAIVAQLEDEHVLDPHRGRDRPQITGARCRHGGRVGRARGRGDSTRGAA